MTEEELESFVTDITTITPNKQLATMVSDLPEEKSAVLMGKFATFFVDVQTWEKKAKAIVVTNENQKAIMDQARQGRLFIRKVRLDVENCRKALKEASLKEGKAIDKVANFLKDALEPIETHLDKQEHFVEHREAEKEAKIQAEIEARMEVERLAEEKRKAEELEVTRRENERLRLVQEKAELSHREAIRKANEASEKALQIEREKLETIRKENEEKLAKERNRVQQLENEVRAKKQAELKAEADKIRQAQLLKSADDIVKMKKLYEDLMNIDWPECTTIEGKKARLEALDHVHVGTTKVEKYIKSKQVQEEEEI